MPSKSYAIEKDAEKRLTVTWQGKSFSQSR